MAAPHAQGEGGLSGRFHRDFQQAVATLEKQIDRLNTTAADQPSEGVDQCLAGIDQLSHDVKDASAVLPAYDQRTYSQRIKGLSERLQTVRNTFNPPKKFSFKNRKATPAVANTSSVESRQLDTTSDTNTSGASTHDPKHEAENQTIVPDPPKDDSDDGIPNTPTIHRPSFSQTTKIAISNHTNLHLIAPPTPTSSTSSATLSHLHRSVIDLSTSSFSALYLKNISSSLILCGQVAGAIHVTNVSDSVLVMTTRQFRMHGSRNVDVYLHASSRPIIEDCVHVRFAPLPGFFSSEDWDGMGNMWDQIDDFGWLKVEPSPNLRVLGVEERIGEDIWGKVKSAGDSWGHEDGDGDREGMLRVVGVE